jgi:hypothetical protein
MKQKKAVYKGLQYVNVYYEDTTPTSTEYFQISEFPLRLTAGKNLFKLRGNPVNLKVGSYLNIEVLDYNGNPIYSEVVNYIDEDKSRVIAIYIYSDTSPGDCTITLLAEAALINGVPVPAEWQGRANVKWTRTVPVNPNISNSSEIIFENTPTVSVQELIGVQLDRNYQNNEQFPIYTTGTVKYFSYNNQPAIEIQNGTFNADMANGTITITSPQNPIPTPNYILPTTSYTSTIKKILNPTTALLDTEYTVLSSQSIFPHTYTEFDYSVFTLQYEATPTYIETENSQSFAYIEITGLEPATGDVSRVKVFTNNNGTVGTWELINDIELEETELFVPSTASLYPDVSIGIFTSQSIIDAYWDGKSFNGTEILAPATLMWTTASIENGMRITSASLNLDNRSQVLIAQTKTDAVFTENSSYKISLDAIGITINTTPAKLSVYVSGSSFYQDPTDFFNQTFSTKLGKRIGDITVTGNTQRFDDYVFSFQSEYTGTGKLLLVVESGDWTVSDIHVTSDNDSGYTPNYTRIKSYVTTTHKLGNQLNFKVEYYNVNGEKSQQISYVNNLDWSGGNRYIDGDYSMLTGSLYVADSLNSGVAISGYPNSGFLRSLGYEGFTAGFPGFLLWSGSAMPNSLGTKGSVPYTGVGLELYANTASYFRYSTTDSEIDVRTNTFFFGNPNGTFISGSNGLLQISSSGFVLNTDGTVTASAFTAIGSDGNTLFDSNSEYVDGVNVGRVVYFDRNEFTHTGANFGSDGTPVTASIFETFILPGETRLQYSATTEFYNASAGSRTLRARWYIQSASVIFSNTSGVNGYDTWSTPEFLTLAPGISILTALSGSTTGTSLTSNVVVGTTGQDNFANCQGKYVRIYMMVDHTSPGSASSVFKMKQFVYRTSRAVGSSTNAPASPIS